MAKQWKYLSYSFDSKQEFIDWLEELIAGLNKVYPKNPSVVEFIDDAESKLKEVNRT